MKETILLIEDEKLMRITLEDALISAGYSVMSFENGKDALEAFKGNPVSAVVTDFRLPDINGNDIIREVIRMRADTQVIMMTGYGTIKDAVIAMKLGAMDYLTKPFALEEFLIIIDRAMEFKNLRLENRRLRKELDKCSVPSGIIGESDAILGVLSLVERVAPLDFTALVLGESGVGKELVASAIHKQSLRRDKPFVKVNCAALPAGLVESEFFGHEPGAFTGALKMKPGRFELADGGTLFLDEIGDLPLNTQAKILRALQEKEFERLGGDETIRVDVRIIAATNKDLEEEIRQGRFREDLYYRLNVVPITMPPLREHREDIPELAEFFLNKSRVKLGRNLSISREAIMALFEYGYPGNVRELENIIERCANLCVSDIIRPEDLPPFVLKSEKTSDSLRLADQTACAEKEHIERTLSATQGNKTRASELLGISRKTLWEKINMYRIEQ
jgi:DNA-binding NtrC family response regulator